MHTGKQATRHNKLFEYVLIRSPVFHSPRTASGVRGEKATRFLQSRSSGQREVIRYLHLKAALDPKEYLLASSTPGSDKKVAGERSKRQGKTSQDETKRTKRSTYSYLLVRRSRLLLTLPSAKLHKHRASIQFIQFSYFFTRVKIPNKTFRY